MKDFISSKGERARGPARPSAKRAQGAGGQDAKRARGPASPRGAAPNRALAKSLAAVAAVALVALGAWWWRAGAEAGRPEPEKPAKAPPDRKPPRKPSARVARTAAPEAPPPPAETNILDWTRAELARVRARMRNASPESLENLKRKEADLEKLLVDEKYQFHMTNVPKVAYQPFKTCTEQVMDWIFNCNVGDDPPPFVPPMDQSEMANISEILDRANELLDEDTPETAERKRMVDAAKKELKEYMAQGGSPSAFLHYYHQQLVTAYEMRLEASRIVREFARDATQEDARKFLERTNAELAKKGIAPVQLSDKMKTKLGIPIEEDTK